MVCSIRQSEARFSHAKQRSAQTHRNGGSAFRGYGASLSRALISPLTRDWLTRLLPAAELVTITEQIAACPDPTDDKFLELAVNDRADIILTGDSGLLMLNPFRNIPIVGPAAFVQRTTQ
ncbi:MAG: putative toxin-antitoxin system toxin component, PIN family [Rhodopila sp.]